MFILIMNFLCGMIYQKNSSSNSKFQESAIKREGESVRTSQWKKLVRNGILKVSDKEN